MQTLLLVCITMFFCLQKAIASPPANEVLSHIVQESSQGGSQDGSEYQVNTSNLLSQAKDLRNTDPQASTTHALEALRLAKDSGIKVLIADVNEFLGDAYAEDKLFDEAKYHYRNAVEIYAELNDINQYIYTNIDLIHLYFDLGEFKQAYTELDTLLVAAKEAGNAQQNVRILILKGRMLYDQKRYDDSIQAFTESLNYLVGDNERSVEYKGAVFHQLGQIYKQQKKYELSYKFHTKARDEHLKLGETNSIVRSLKNMSIIKFRMNDLLPALDHIIRALNLISGQEKTEEEAELLIHAGMVYRNLLRYETALDYIVKAHRIYTSFDNVPRIAESLNQMGLLYTRLNKYEQSRSFYQMATELPKHLVPQETLASSYRELAVIELKSNNSESAMQMAQKANTLFLNAKKIDKAIITSRIIGEIYYEQSEFNKAIEFYQLALSYAEQIKNKKNLVKVLNNLGRSLLRIKDASAETVFLRSLSISTENNYLSEKETPLIELTSIAKKRDDYQKALIYSEALLEVRQEAFELNERNKLAHAKARLDSHLMETELDSLRKKVELDSLTLAKKQSEIEIARQANQISELELVKNRYASFLLAILLIVCFCTALYILRIFVDSRRQNKELDYLATHDPLTNCLNRRGLFENIERDFNEVENAQCYSVIMADIDRFKSVNDTYGHDTGDNVLCSVAKLIQSCVRRSDIVARYGGEEFCIALYGTSTKEALRIAESMRTKLEAARFENINVTCSFGICSSEKVNENPTKLISKADKALYKSKLTGRNKVTLWDESLDV